MNCLNDFEVQAAVDGEAEEVSRAHLVSCERCKARVDERRQDMAELTAMMGAAELPVNVEARLRRALDD